MIVGRSGDDGGAAVAGRLLFPRDVDVVRRFFCGLVHRAVCEGGRCKAPVYPFRVGIRTCMLVTCRSREIAFVLVLLSGGRT